MADYCDLTLKAAGPVQQTEAFASHWNGLLKDMSTPDPAGFIGKILEFHTEYPGVPEKPVPYYDRDYMGCVIDNGLVRIDAISNWRPPLELVSAMSARWPDLEFVLSCSVEHEMYETWHFRAGAIAIIDLWTTNIQAHEDDEPDSWYVRNGELLNWPNWHTAQWNGKVWVHPMPQWAVEPYLPAEDPMDTVEKAAEEIVGFFGGDDRKE